MNDITALMATMKAAAEKATPGPWYVHDKPCEDGNYGIDTSDKEFLAEAVVWWGFARQSIWREEDAKYIALANPANVKVLVEALEAGDTENERMARDLISRNGEIEGLRKRVEELEEVATDYGMKFQRAQDDLKKMALMKSRTVAVKFPEVRITIAESKLRNLTYQQLDAYNAGATRAAVKLSQVLAAAGIQVIEGEQKNS
ncbi:ead/Ea22-like family protein [Klebsiella sp. WP8-S18-ESBL-06]|uniref:ead/Ea22-like family protein n=1 Tax=Klebsiella sp. WP8-S18-ESBL-06 TaxID=2675726 RepID=UPI0015DCDB81|nr:ead/Ea22-like family protein [Klebsiella sp. WP8-S18-ESBL-06]BBT70443.1 hypothetical protein WP8S18E06_17420 [Klebsiella sp. WP8-S18-ESBL-06]